MFIAHTAIAFWHHFHPWITKNMDLEAVSHFASQNPRKSQNYVHLARLEKESFSERLVKKFQLPVEGWRGTNKRK